MPRLPTQESDTVEFKESWTEKALKDLAAFLKNLDLLSDGRPTNAAVLLFGKRPQQIFGSACIRAGFFRDINDFDLFPDCAGTIFEQVEQAIQQVDSSYPVRMTFPSAIQNLRERRVETPAFPPAALREAIVNAVIHRDFAHAGREIEVKMFPDFLWIANAGGLLPDVTLDELRIKPHTSARRNPLIAKICYMDHLVERYGTGTTRMIDECRKAGFPPPEFRNTDGGFQVTIRRQIVPEQPSMHAPALKELSFRQQEAMRHVAMHGAISPAEYQRILGIPARTASRDLKELVKAGLLKREGTRKALRYLLRPNA